ncbi:hypothetical protein, partial [Mycoplasmopsis meleagridis]|uniref:hypothetical protein n=1 Tax=Mycoplasmopsis meleagridis TaxID=29561 RepID=UPI00073D7D9A
MTKEAKNLFDPNSFKKPPIFTEEKLKEIFHYTDLEANPTYVAFKSKAFFKIYCGAKGVSKSFSRMVETVYRIVNEKNFNSVWCRNQYNHIKNTLKPTFEKVLDFLAEVHQLDYRPYFLTYSDAVYWNYDDGGKGRAILFQNWESIQAFQGITLKKRNFFFGEIVIDEPIEDPTDVKKTTYQLKEIYEIQKEKLPLLIENTILRTKAPEGFNRNISFLFNIFTTEHFLVKDYLNKVLKILDAQGMPNMKLIDLLIKDKFLQVEYLEFKQNLGIVITIYSKLFVPAETIDSLQLAKWEDMKQENYRLWAITVAGFAFNAENKNEVYYMRNIIYNPDLTYNTDYIKWIEPSEINKKIFNSKTGEYLKMISWGFDIGIKDKSALVGIFLLNTGKVIVF